MKNFAAWIVGIIGLLLIGVIYGGSNSTDVDNLNMNGFEVVGRGIVALIVFVVTIAIVIAIIKSNEKEKEL